MQKILFLMLVSGCLQHLSAQKKVSYLVKAGESPVEVLPTEALYVLPAFTQGTIYLRDGSVSTQLLNYHFGLGEMQFITPQKDTLAIADPALIKNVIIDTIPFYFDKGFMQVIAQADSFTIAVKQTLTQENYSTASGYNGSSASSAITSYSSINTTGKMYYLQVQKDVMFQKVSTYFLGDKFNHFFKADKKNFLNVFSSKRDLLLKYLKETQVNFDKPEDLKKLLLFCINEKA